MSTRLRCTFASQDEVRAASKVFSAVPVSELATQSLFMQKQSSRVPVIAYRRLGTTECISTEPLDGKCGLEGGVSKLYRCILDFHDTHLRPRCMDEDRGNQDLINMISREAVTGGVHGSTSHALPYERARRKKRVNFGT
jgi:hypothetical protein